MRVVWDNISNIFRGTKNIHDLGGGPKNLHDLRWGAKIVLNPYTLDSIEKGF